MNPSEKNELDANLRAADDQYLALAQTEAQQSKRILDALSTFLLTAFADSES